MVQAMRMSNDSVCEVLRKLGAKGGEEKPHPLGPIYPSEAASDDAEAAQAIVDDALFSEWDYHGRRVPPGPTVRHEALLAEEEGEDIVVEGQVPGDGPEEHHEEEFAIRVQVPTERSGFLNAFMGGAPASPDQGKLSLGRYIRQVVKRHEDFEAPALAAPEDVPDAHAERDAEAELKVSADEAAD